MGNLESRRAKAVAALLTLMDAPAAIALDVAPKIKGSRGEDALGPGHPGHSLRVALGDPPGVDDPCGLEGWLDRAELAIAVFQRRQPRDETPQEKRYWEVDQHLQDHQLVARIINRYEGNNVPFVVDQEGIGPEAVRVIRKAHGRNASDGTISKRARRRAV